MGRGGEGGVETGEPAADDQKVKGVVRRMV